MKILLITLWVLALVAISTSLHHPKGPKAIDYRLKYNSVNSNRTEEKCTGTGIVCTDCFKIGYCPNSGSSPIVTEVCPLGEICDSKTTTCVKPPGRPECSPTDHLNFLCAASGMFPNPGDCKRYHFCVPKGTDLEHTQASCDEGYAYSAKTTFCDKVISNNVCNGYPVPLCTYSSQNGAVPENPSLYYTCLPHPSEPDVLYPFITACPHGKIYSPENGCT